VLWRQISTKSADAKSSSRVPYCSSHVIIILPDPMRTKPQKSQKAASKRLLRCRIDEVINFAIAIPTGGDSGNRPGTSSTQKETVTGDRSFRNQTGFLPIATKDSTNIIKETLILTSCAILVFNRSRNSTLLLLHS
jgi:hypothetical protein